jgi:large subunit ribosomal protein L25
MWHSVYNFSKSHFDMENVVLDKRDLKGKKCKKLVREGLVPCVIYNIKGETKLCQVNRGTAERLIKGITSSTMLDIEYEKKNLKALVKDIDTNPKTDAIRHISFFELDENTALTFEIPFVLDGVAPAVKNNIGVLIQTTNYIMVKCKSKDLVPQIKVDISSLEEIGDSILVSEIEIPSEFEILNEEEVLNYTIATITELQKEIVEEEPEEEEEEGEELGEEEEVVEGEEKKETEGEEPTE